MIRAYSATLYLNDGKILRGKITKEIGDIITIKTEDQEKDVNRKDIKKITGYDYKAKTQEQSTQPGKPTSEANKINMKGKMAIGLNYPGISFRYGLRPKIILEGKYQTGEGVSLIGGRGYYLLSKMRGMPDKIVTFWGAEADMVSFKGDESEGSGIAGEVFAGGEYFFDKKLSLQLDFGPAFIALNDSNYLVSQSGMEFVINLGINYYFKTGSK